MQPSEYSGDFIDLENDLVLDCETTGLDEGVARDEPIEISIIKVGDSDPVFHSYVRPTARFVPDEVYELTGIDPKAIETAPYIDEIIDQIGQLTEGRTVWAYNSPFDERVIMNACHHARVMMPVIHWSCAMRSYAANFGQQHPKRSDDYKWHPLTQAYEQQTGSVMDGSHTAFVDCQMTAALLRMIAGDGLVRCAGHGAFPVVFDRLTINLTQYDKPYATFTTVGGQSVNIFQDKWAMLTRSGIPIYNWSQMILKTKGKGVAHDLKEPIGGQIVYKGAWTELVEIGSGEWG